MYYVYCIESHVVSGHYYIGFTENLRQRLTDHNRGSNPSTAPYVPWKLRGILASIPNFAHVLLRNISRPVPGMLFERSGSGSVRPAGNRDALDISCPLLARLKTLRPEVALI
jgi:hypothetical protein